MEDFPVNRAGMEMVDDVACIILAGGEGSRLQPLTQSRCKPAVGFGGRYKLIDVPISNALNSEINTILVISQYFSSDLNQHIQKTYPFDCFQGGRLGLLTPETGVFKKGRYQGTADAIRQNLSYLKQLPMEYFLILSGDQLYNMDLKKMVNFAKRKGAGLTIAAFPVGEEEAPRLGLLSIDQESRIESFYEKPKEKKILSQLQLPRFFLGHASPCYLASMGIYVFHRDVLFALLDEDNRKDFGQHLIPTQIRKGGASAFLHQGYWEDIGTINTYYQANLSLINGRSGFELYNEMLPIYSLRSFLPGAQLTHTHVNGALICEGAVIDAGEVTHSIIGRRSIIEKGTVIRHSILLGNGSYGQKASSSMFRIGRNCLIHKAIIDEDVIIGDHVRLINEKRLMQWEGGGVYIKNGVIVVPKNAHIPDHFMI